MLHFYSDEPLFAYLTEDNYLSLHFKSLLDPPILFQGDVTPYIHRFTSSHTYLFSIPTLEDLPAFLESNPEFLL